MKSGILVAVMAVVTIMLRFLPFWIFKNRIPEYVIYLGEVLPSAIIGMLVIYCLKDVSILVFPHGLPELIAAVLVIGLQIFKRNSLVSILSGTILYMILVQFV
jgi:branched-subunit amino acid transport protein AzlD